MAKSTPIEPLKKRPDYLKVAASGIKQVRPTLVVQFLPGREQKGPARVGLTVSGKTGGAVERNRIKRRFRRVITEIMPGVAHSGAGYVVIARQSALKCPFEDLKKDLKSAVLSLHSSRKTGSRT